MKTIEQYNWKERLNNIGASILQLAKMTELHPQTLYKLWSGETKVSFYPTVKSIENGLRELERKYRLKEKRLAKSKEKSC